MRNGGIFPDKCLAIASIRQNRKTVLYKLFCIMNCEKALWPVEDDGTSCSDLSNKSKHVN